MTSQASSPQNSLKTEYILPFVNSLQKLFVDHLGGTITVGKPELNETGAPRYELCGVIAFTGTVIGRVVVSWPVEVAEKVVENYLHISPLPDGMLEDCVGELANVIAGRAKADLETHQIVISPPTVIRGEDYEIAPQKGAACLSLPCQCNHGPLQLEVSIVQAN